MQVTVMFLTGLPFSSMNLTQKSLIPGPLITAPRRMFLPFLRVMRLETQSSITIRRSPERITASSSLSHHIEAELEPTARRTLGMSCSQLRNCVEDNAVAGLVVAGCKTVEFYIEEFAVVGVPYEGLLCGHGVGEFESHRRTLTVKFYLRLFEDCRLHFLAVFGDCLELVGVVLLGELFADVTVHKHCVATVWASDGVEQQPTSDEAVFVGAGGRLGRRYKIVVDARRGRHLLLRLCVPVLRRKC